MQALLTTVLSSGGTLSYVDTTGYYTSGYATPYYTQQWYNAPPTPPPGISMERVYEDFQPVLATGSVITMVVVSVAALMTLYKFLWGDSK